MKRSDINRYVTEAISFFEDHHFCLPPYYLASDYESLMRELS